MHESVGSVTGRASGPLKMSNTLLLQFWLEPDAKVLHSSYSLTISASVTSCHIKPRMVSDILSPAHAGCPRNSTQLFTGENLMLEGITIWEIQLLAVIASDARWKRFCLRRTETCSAFGFYENALYKFTFTYLLTYLLMPFLSANQRCQSTEGTFSCCNYQTS